MFVISDFPPYVIDQIVGVQDTSYVVIKLWLCGSFQLNTKLSKGLNYLRLKCHKLGECRFPRLISQLTSLRHLTIHSRGNLAESKHDWPEIMRSLPNRLELLAIVSDDFDYCIWNYEDVENIPHKRTYTRGKPHVIEFATLFPRLHTLELLSPWGYDPLSSELIPALPASLTHLYAALELSYYVEKGDHADGSDDYGFKQPLTISHLSRLPPNIMLLESISWFWNSSKDFDAMRRDFANAPSSLQTIKFAYPLAWVRDKDDECWLPKSLTKVDWHIYDCPPWSSTRARTMPSQLRTLSLRDVDLLSFGTTNGVADLPRSLTSLRADPYNFSDNFVEYGHLLPPHLTKLTLWNSVADSFCEFNTWSTISGNNYWPSTLKSLKIEDFWIDPRAVVNLPKTLETLALIVSAPATREEIEQNLVLHASMLPPNLTSLHLTWTPKVTINLALAKFDSILTLTLQFQSEKRAALPTTHLFDRLPKSLTTLKLLNVGILAPIEGNSLSDDLKLPNLTSLEASYIYSIDLFKHLPHGLRNLDVGIILPSSIVESPLLADGQLYKDLPPTLTRLRVLFNLGPNFKSPSIPAQSFNHLPLLKHLCIGSIPKMPSNILRTLPRSLTHLQLNVTEWNEDDLPYLPPQLHVCYLENITPKVVEYMSLRSLGSLDQDELSSEVSDIAKNRVLQASQNQ